MHGSVAYAALKTVEVSKRDRLCVGIESLLFYIGSVPIPIVTSTQLSTHLGCRDPILLILLRLPPPHILEASIVSSVSRLTLLEQQRPWCGRGK